MPIQLQAITRGFVRTPLDAIPEEVIEAVEEAYQHCKDVPDERIQAQFPTQEDADKFLTDARSYAYQREAGRLVVTGNSTKKGFARFRVETYVAPANDGGESPGNSDNEQGGKTE